MKVRTLWPPRKVPAQMHNKSGEASLTYLYGCAFFSVMIYGNLHGY
jgi:hypothetical protein